VKLAEKQDNILCPLLLKATGLEGLEEEHAHEALENGGGDLAVVSGDPLRE